MKKLRKKMNLTQKELADKLFVSQRTISSYELGIREPNCQMIIRLANVLNCSIADIVLCFA